MKSFFLIILSIFTCLFIYRNSINAYFFQDDWFTLTISKAGNTSEVINFFIPRPDIIYYRPLGMQVPFFILRTIFGLNPQPFHFLVILTHILNVFLVYYLSCEILKKSFQSLILSFLYATSAVNFIPFYWASTYPFILGPTFYFLSFILFLKFLKSEKLNFLIFSIIGFILGVLVNEMIITLPAVILIYLIFNKNYKNIKLLISYILIGFLFFCGRFILSPPPAKGLYEMGIGWYIFSNLKSYFFWSFNWSEVMTEQMVRPFIFNNLVMENYGYVAYISEITLLVFFVLLLLGIYKLINHKNKEADIKIIILGALWFSIGLSPVLLFSQHKFSYYLPISLVGLLLAVITIYGNLLNYKIISAVLLFAWVTVSFVSVNYNNKQHWAPRRSNISRRFTEIISNNKPTDKSISIPYDPENKLALNDQDAVKYLLGRDFSVIYEK